MMSGHGPNPIFFNKKEIKIGRPEHSLTSNSLRAITSHFCLTPNPNPLPPQTGRHMCIIPKYVKLLGIHIDHKLSFDEHVSSLCKKREISLMPYPPKKYKKEYLKSYIMTLRVITKVI